MVDELARTYRMSHTYCPIFLCKILIFLQVDLATTMAEMFHKSDKDKNDNLDLNEFIKGMLDHPVTSKILQMKKIDAILELM